MSDHYAHKGDRPPWSWQGVTALVLATCLGLGWLLGITLAAIEAAGADGVGLDGELASLLNGIGQVLAGALGTYLGFSAGATQRAQSERPQRPTAPVEPP